MVHIEGVDIFKFLDNQLSYFSRFIFNRMEIQRKYLICKNRVRELKAEMKQKLADISHRVRNGSISLDIKMTESSIADYALIHPEYLEIKDKYDQAERKLIDYEVMFDMINDLLENLRERKDMLISKASLMKSEIYNDLSNVKTQKEEKKNE